jgi:site-specific recombinase XerD
VADLALPASVELASLREEAEHNAERAQAAATIRAYRFDWACFTKWCAQHGFESLPAKPETVALYITDMAKSRKTATVSRRLTTITKAHREQGYANPVEDLVVQQVWRGIRNRYGIGKTAKSAAKTADVRAMVATLNLDRLIGIRDRCLLVVGFAGAFRRSELVALNVGDIAEEASGLRVQIRRSKTDQEAEGASIGLPYGSDILTCPVRCYRDWLAVSEITDGPVFRAITRHGRMAATRLTDRTVARVVKRTAEAAGYNPQSYAGHSLRSGLITSAAEAGVSDRNIMRHSRHKSVTVMHGYIQNATVFRDNAAAAVGL